MTGNADTEFLVAFVSQQDHHHGWAEAVARYADRQPDFADLCLIRMSELFPKHRSSRLTGKISEFTAATSARPSR